MNPVSADILIYNGTVLTMNGDNEIIENGAVAIDGEGIACVTDLAGAAGIKAETRIDAGGGIIMPGLVNTHTHMPMSLFRGMADDLPLMTWLHDHIFPAEAKYINRDTARLGTLLSCAEMLLSGTTTCCDGYFYEEFVAEAVMKAGMRAVLGQGVIDFPAPGVPDPSENVVHALDYVRKLKNRDSRITPSIFCHSPWTCSRNTLSQAKEAANGEGVLFQIHVAETRDEVSQMRKDTGLSPIQYLDSIGLLDSQTILVHSIWVDDEDIALIKRSGASISHNPASNMKLASGVAPVHRYISGGIRTGLGTDSSASNNNLDLFREMDSAAKIHKAFNLEPTMMNASTVLHMATIAGAAAIGLDHVAGSLERGKKADIIVVETEKPHLMPMYNPVSQLVYSASGSDVKHVVVDGRVVVKDRKLTTLDLDPIFEEIRAFAATVKGSN